MIAFKKISQSVLGILFINILTTCPCYGFIKEFGMGEVAVSYPQSSTVARYNPAGILEVGDRFDGGLGFFYLNGDVSIKDSELSAFNQSSSTTQCKWIPAGILGYSKMITPSLSVALSTDAGLTSTKGTVSDGLNALGTGPLCSESIVGILVPTIAYRWGNHDFGISAPLNVGRIKTNGLQNFIPISIHPNHVTNKGYDWAQALTLRFGWLYHVTDNFDIGASYFTKQLCGSHFQKYKGLLPLDGKFEVAPEIRVGATYHFCKAAISCQFTCYNFKSCKTFANPVDATAPLGSSNGAGAGFKNVCILAVGFDYELYENFKIRAGYDYQFAPFILKSNILTGFLRPSLIPRHTILLGGTQSYCNYYFDFATAITPKRRVTSGSVDSLAGGKLSSNGMAIVGLVGGGVKF